MRLRGILIKAAEKASTRVNNYGAQYSASAIFFFVFYVANPYKWHISGHYNPLTIIILRAISLALFLALAAWRFWPKKLLPYLPLFWLFVLFYNLPMRTTFTIFHSAYSHSYATYGVLGFVVLAVLVDNLLYISLAITGAITGILLYFLGGGYALPLSNPWTIAQATYMVFSISFIKLVFFRNHNLRLESKISAYRTLAIAIAHEIRSPLCAINVACQSNRVNKNKYSSSGLIKRLNGKVLNIIDAILLQMKFLESSNNTQCEPINLHQCVYEAYSCPIFSDADKALIFLDIDQKHHVKADKGLLLQVIINLIRNSLRAIKQKPDGYVRILAQYVEANLVLIVYDNGTGINLEQQRNLFKLFHSLNKNGIGIGLAFSKLAIESMGYSIACESCEGSFTRFVITFCDPNKEKGFKHEITTGLSISHNSCIS